MLVASIMVLVFTAANSVAAKIDETAVTTGDAAERNSVQATVTGILRIGHS
jgi:hypothetical protein